tara:strand:+ start:272 stop:676 length:405 start_codon:yes stop_codon:yes gene_type:complete
MSIGTWEPPEKKKRTHIKLTLIRRFLSFAKELDLEQKVAPADIRSARLEQENWVMSKEKEYWQELFSMEVDELDLLARLFTILERDLSGWEGGKFCPVIYIVKELRKRGESIVELKRWIKTHSKNRYLPYGSAI